MNRNSLDSLTSPGEWTESPTHDPVLHSHPSRLDNQKNDPAQTAQPWAHEGAGERFGYDKHEPIDWIYEHTQDRLRQRFNLSKKPDVSRRPDTSRSRAERQHGNPLHLSFWQYILELVDNSQLWLLLIATGFAAGCAAALIDIVGGWLGDFKSGFCSNVEAGGKFYLSKPFCCLGYDDTSNCHDWRSWGEALFGRPPGGGVWITNFMFYIIFTTIFATCASILVFRYSIPARHSGIPEIKASIGGLTMDHSFTLPTLFIKSIGLCLSSASGLCLGKEGPLVHISCCCGTVLLRLFPEIRNNEGRKREVLAAAAAAGFAAAFGSPIGGVLFCLEQLATFNFPDRTMWQTFVTAMASAVTLQFLNPFRTGKLVLFQVELRQSWYWFEMVPFLLLGLIGGLHGGLFVRLNMRIAQLRERLWIRRYPVFEVLALAIVTAVISYPIPFMRAQTTEALYMLFSDCSDVGDDLLGLCSDGKSAGGGAVFLLLLSAAIVFFLAAATFGALLPAGILLPTMFIGALYGRVIGILMSHIQAAFPSLLLAPFSCSPPDDPVPVQGFDCLIRPGGYAIVGAASALAGSTRMIVTVVVVMFELTGALVYALPIMIAAIIAKWIADAICAYGIYDAWIRLHGWPLLDSQAEESNISSAGGDTIRVPDPAGTGRAGIVNLYDLTGKDVMVGIEDMVIVSSEGSTVGSLQALLQKCPFQGFAIVEARTPSQINRTDAKYLGHISRRDLSTALTSAVSSPGEVGPKTAVSFLRPPDVLFDGTSTAGSIDQVREGDSAGQNNNVLSLHHIVDHTGLTLPPTAPAHLIFTFFRRLGLRHLVFLHRGRLRGLITRKDVWRLYDASRNWTGTGAGRSGALEREMYDDDYDDEGYGYGDGDGGGRGGIAGAVAEMRRLFSWQKVRKLKGLLAAGFRGPVFESGSEDGRTWQRRRQRVEVWGVGETDAGLRPPGMSSGRGGSLLGSLHYSGPSASGSRGR